MKKNSRKRGRGSVRRSKNYKGHRPKTPACLNQIPVASSTSQTPHHWVHSPREHSRTPYRRQPRNRKQNAHRANNLQGVAETASSVAATCSRLTSKEARRPLISTWRATLVSRNLYSKHPSGNSTRKQWRTGQNQRGNR